MMCQACSEGRHWDCGKQIWCECECDPETAILDLALTPRDYANPDAEWDDEQDWLSSQILGLDAA